jgi:rhamnosyltransferase
MNIYTCIVTYFPDEQAINRFEQLRNANVKLLIFDNTPIGNNFSWDKYGNNVLSEGKNIGLGSALKKISQEAKSRGATHMLYFDQDIIFDLNTLNWIQSWCESHKMGKEIGLVWFCPNTQEWKAPELSNPYPIKIAVSHASLINLEAASLIGWHTDRWFVEGIDYDFCFRLVQAGYALMGVKHCPGIDSISNQPGFHYKDRKGRKRLARILPMSRLGNFWVALLNLSWRALWQGPRSYVYLFIRNIFTNAYDQLWAIFKTFRLRICKK